MKKIIITLSILFSLHSHAKLDLTEICGAVETVSNHRFSQGSVSSILIQDLKGDRYLLHDEEDLKGTLAAVAKNEDSTKEFDLNNISFSYDETQKYYFFKNYQLKNNYSVCATVDTSSNAHRFIKNVAYSLYLESSEGKKLLYKN